MSINDDLLKTCERAARAGAVKLLEWKGRFHAREKGPADLVTEADLAAQEAVRGVIAAAHPDHDVLAEEDREELVRRSDYCWIVDPLDGTTNYVHGVPHYAVSVAVAHNDQVIAGVVFDPSMDECFTVLKGGGAWLNKQPIHASRVARLSQALVVVSFPTRVVLGSRPMQDFEQVVLRAQAVRRTGSASLNMCYVACGRFDAYFARETKAWDVAAAALLISEAGGTITGIDGREFSLSRPKFIAAGSAELHAELIALIGGE